MNDSSRARTRTARQLKAGIGPMVLGALLTVCPPALAGWDFNGPPSPNAFVQSGDMSLELQCERMRFAPAGYEDTEDIVNRQALSIRFMKDGQTETGAFQAGRENADIRMVDNYPVEIVFRDGADYDFVLEQIGENAVLNLSMVDQDVSYGIFDLRGARAAIGDLRRACGDHSGGEYAGMEAPEGIVYCGGGGIKRQIEYLIIDEPRDKWDARVTVNGETMRAMTSYSYFGNNAPPKDFVVALLGEDRSEFLVFSRGNEHWLEFGDYTYRQCN